MAVCYVIETQLHVLFINSGRASCHSNTVTCTIHKYSQGIMS